MTTTPAIINTNRDLRKDEWKEMAIQQKDHIASLMERLEREKEMYSRLYSAGYDLEKEIQALQTTLHDVKMQSLLLLEKQREELAELCAEELEAQKAELVPKFDCDVYWAVCEGDLCLYKVPNDVACINNKNGKNAVLQALQEGCFGEAWGTFTTLEIVEVTREELQERLGDTGIESDEEEEEEEEEEEDCTADEPPCDFCGKKVTERDCPCLEEEEPKTPKSHKDIAIDQLNEEPITPAFEPLHEGATHQVVRGSFSVEFIWKVPAGINLRDTDTYEFGDRWGVLQITNTITGERLHIEDRDEEDDFKEAYELEVEDRDDDNDAC